MFRGSACNCSYSCESIYPATVTISNREENPGFFTSPRTSFRESVLSPPPLGKIGPLGGVPGIE